MPPEARKLMVDIQSGIDDIRQFTSAMDLAGYRLDAKCRAAVERKFDIIGEACARIRDRFPELFSRIASGHQIIGFRNRLIHGYDNVDDAIVWDIVTRKIPVLAKEIESLGY